MDAEILLILKEEQDSIGDRSDTKLERVAILYELCAVASDSLLDLSDAWQVKCVEWVVGLYDVRELRDMYEVVSANEWHLLIELSDDDPSLLSGGLAIVTRGAEAAVTLFVGIGELHDSDIGVKDSPRLHHRGYLVEVRGDEVRTLLIDSGTRVGSDEVGHKSEVSLHLGCCVGALAQGDHVEDADVVKALIVSHQGSNARLRYSGRMR